MFHLIVGITVGLVEATREPAHDLGVRVLLCLLDDLAALE
jgi:hypothetical protein